MQASDKKKRWIEILAFLIVTVVLLKAASYIMDPIRLNKPDCVDERDRYVASALTEEKDTIDVAVLGDSEALVLLSPPMLYDEEGISSYIIGQSGQRISEAYYTLEELIKTQSPKVVILETDMIVIDSDERREALGSFTSASYHYFPIFRYHGMWKEMYGIKEPMVMDHDRGFAVRADVNPYTDGEYMIPTEEKYRLLLSTRYYLEQIIKLCDEKGISILMVSAPSPSNSTYEKHNALQAFADEKGIDFIDFNLKLDEIGIDWETDSLDYGDHVNYNGTEKLSKYLMKYLKDNYDLEDHRGDN